MPVCLPTLSSKRLKKKQHTYVLVIIPILEKKISRHQINYTVIIQYSLKLEKYTFLKVR